MPGNSLESVIYITETSIDDLYNISNRDEIVFKSELDSLTRTVRQADCSDRFGMGAEKEPVPRMSLSQFSLVNKVEIIYRSIGSW